MIPSTIKISLETKSGNKVAAMEKIIKRAIKKIQKKQ